MTSTALRAWRGHRTEELARARALVLQDTASASGSRDLHLGTYLRVMCSEFQAFCTDLYAEAVDTVGAALPRSTAPGLRDLLREALASQTRLDAGNPTSHNLVRDFDRVGVNLRHAWTAAPGDRETLDDQILRVRNDLVHGNARLASLPVRVELDVLDAWRETLDRLAVSMDTVVWKELAALLRTAPARGGDAHG